MVTPGTGRSASLSPVSHTYPLQEPAPQTPPKNRAVQDVHRKVQIGGTSSLSSAPVGGGRRGQADRRTSYVPLELDPVCVEYSVTCSCALHLWSSNGFPGTSAGQQAVPRAWGGSAHVHACLLEQGEPWISELSGPQQWSGLSASPGPRPSLDIHPDQASTRDTDKVPMCPRLCPGSSPRSGADLGSLTPITIRRARRLSRKGRGDDDHAVMGTWLDFTSHCLRSGTKGTALNAQTSHQRATHPAYPHPLGTPRIPT